MQIKTPAWRTPNPAWLRPRVLQVEGPASRTYGRRSMSDVHHETVLFSGHVQGVGFRYSVLQVAKEFDVAGYVSNLADGRVQLEAEGAERDVNAFVDAVQERMHGYIRKLERSGRKRPRLVGVLVTTEFAYVPSR